MTERPKRAKNGETAAWIEKHFELRSNKCMPWPFGRHSGGSKGAFYDKKLGQGVDVQSYICERARGPRPKGCILKVKCQTHLCCNRRHLTWKPNRHEGPYKYPFAKLEPEQIPIIRAQLARGSSTREVARRFNVTSLTISLIGRGRTWAWVK